MSCTVTLKEKGLRLTPQRRLILDIIHTSDGSLTGAEIVSRVQAKMPSVNKSTVYRTLELLERLGCVFKSETGSESVYYHPEEGHNYHLICHSCGRSIDLDEKLFLAFERSIAQDYGFQVDYRHIIIGGLCHRCQYIKLIQRC